MDNSINSKPYLLNWGNTYSLLFADKDNARPHQAPEPKEITVRLKQFSMEKSTKETFYGIGIREAFGEVVQKGKGVKNFKKGDFVALLIEPGLSEYINVPANAVLKLSGFEKRCPNDLDQLSSLIKDFSTGIFKKNQRVAILGDGAEVQILSRLAKSAGAKVVSASSANETIKELLETNIDGVIRLDYKDGVINEFNEYSHGHCYDLVFVSGDEWFALDIAANITNEKSCIHILSEPKNQKLPSNRIIKYHNLNLMESKDGSTSDSMLPYIDISFSSANLYKLFRIGKINDFAKNVSNLLNNSKKVYISL